MAGQREAFRELRVYNFKGSFPEVPTFPGVDTTLLYEGDDNPFHVVIPIATVGETSQNGLVYDDTLVNAIEQQLPGQGGIRGHRKDEELPYIFPVDAVHWVGSARVGETLWAKGYIPPGEHRDDIRRRKARGAGIGTSVFGSAVRESLGSSKSRTWRAKSFKLESLDLGDANRISRITSGEFAITSELRTEDSEMSDINTITVADVPEAVREQIIRDAKLRTDAARVSELETRISELAAKVEEFRQYGTIIAEIRSNVGATADVPALLAEYYTTVSALAKMLGIPSTNITVRVEEMQTQIGELRKAEFNHALDQKVAEFTNWTVNGDAAKAKVDALRKAYRARLAAAAVGTDPAKIAELAKSIWDDEFKVLAEMAVASLAGPSALVSGQSPASTIDQYRTDEGMKALKAKFGMGG